MKKAISHCVKCILSTALFIGFFTNNLTAQQFDVALKKTTITAIPVDYGTAVPFNLTIYNQGTDTIMNVQVIEHYGVGYEFQSGINSGWMAHATITNAAVFTYTDKIPPGENRIVTINLIVKPASNRVDWINTAEVVSFTDVNGVDQTANDPDSTGDEDPDNDAGGLLGSPADDYILGDGTGVPNDGVAATDEDDHDRDTIRVFDLALKKVLDPITGYTYGDTLTFTTTVYNQGNVHATQVRVRDIIPEGYINPVNVNNTLGWSSTDVQNPVYTIANLAVGDSVSFDIKLVLTMTMVNENAWDNYTEIISARDQNLVNISAYDADSEFASNTPGERSVKQGDPDDNYLGNNPVNPGYQDDHDPAQPEIFDLALIKERNTAAPSFNYYTPIDYIYTLVNQGNMTATDIVIIDTLPCGAKFDPMLNPGWTFDTLTRIATTTVPGPLQGGQQIQGNIVLTVVPCYDDPATAWTNYIEIAQATNIHGVQTTEIDGVFDSNFSNDPGGVSGTPSDNQLDGDGINDEDNHDVELLQVYDLALRKDLITQGPYTEGQIVDYRIRVYNQGNVVVKDLIVEDFVPPSLGYDFALNQPLGWTNSFSTTVNGVPTTFNDTLNFMGNIYLQPGDSVDIMTKLSIEFTGQYAPDWYNFAHVFVATDTSGNNRFDDSDSNPFMPTALEFSVLPGSPEDNNITSDGKSVMPPLEEDDHDVANISFFDLALTKTNTTANPMIGQPATFDIVVENQGNNLAHHITVTDHLPCGLVFDPASNPGWTVNGNMVEYLYTDTLFAGDSFTVPLTVTVQQCNTPGQSNFINFAEISNAFDEFDNPGDDQDSTPDLDPTNDPEDEDDSDTDTIYIYDLALSKELVPPVPSYAPGNNFEYEITINNQGTVDAYNVQVVDYIPCGFDIPSSGNAGWSVDANGDYVYTIAGPIAPGDSATIPVTLVANNSCPTGGLDVSNGAEIVSSEDEDGSATDIDSTPDNDPNNDPPGEDDIDFVPLDVFDLSLQKTHAPLASVSYGDVIDYTITVTNEGTVNALNVEVTDYIPCGLSLSGNNGSWAYDILTGNAKTTIPGPILPGQSADVHIFLEVQPCDTPTADAYTNVGEISAAEDPDGPADDVDSTPDNDPNNDPPGEDDIDTDPFDVFDLSLSKTVVLPNPLAYGADATYTLSITNEGSVDATNIEVTDYLPCGLAFNPADNPGWTLNQAGTMVVNTYTGTIHPGESVDLTLVLTIQPCSEAGGHTNQAEISAAEDPNGPVDDVDSTPDNNPNNDPPGEDDTDIVPFEVFDLSLSKLVNIGLVPKYGDQLSYSITVTNEGSAQANDIEVSDYVPCGFSFDAALNPGWTYNSLTGIATTIISGPIAPGDNAVVNLTLILEQCDNINEVAYNNLAEISDSPDDIDSTPDDNPDNDPPGEDDIDNDPVYVLDLAITKQVVNPQPNYLLGDQVTFEITVENQGNLAASLVEVTDYIPCGMSLAPGNTIPWVVTGDKAKYTLPDPLAVGASVTVQITMVVGICDNETGTRTNKAEISTVEVDGGPYTDSDSTPDDNPDNDPPGEDDIDEATVVVLIGSDIGDFVWNDMDGDGVQDFGEQGIPGVKVTLYTQFGGWMGETTTDGNGHYQFDDVYPGEYYIVFEDPSGQYDFTTPDVGNDTKDSDVTGDYGPGSTALFTAVAGEDEFTIDAGMYKCALIKGVTYYDINEDDIRQPTENGVNGLVVSLYRKVGGTWILWDSEETHHDYATPSDDGIWDFCVQPGTYYIKIDLPPIGLVQVIPFKGGPNYDSDINNANGPGTTNSFTLQGGGSITNLGAGYYPMATVGNTVWHDQNYDGIQNPGESKVSGVTVQLYDENNQLVDETVTNSFGVYKMEYLEKKSYYLKFIPPAGYGFTYADAGADDVDSDVNHALGLNTTNLVSFNPGDEVEVVDAGLVFGVLPVTLGGFEIEGLDDSNRLDWWTVSESNTDYFEIERMLEGEKTFVPVGKVKAAGNSTIRKDYNFDDFDIRKSGIYYYRIKQVDVDGGFNYFEVKSVYRSTNGGLTAYPSPTAGIIHWEIPDVTSPLIRLRLINAEGKIVVDKMVDGDTRSFDLSRFKSGVYQLIIHDASTIYRKKIIKVN